MKAAIYCRLSEEDRIKTKEDSESIQNQKSMLVNYATEKGWEIFGIYCDENYSGIDGDRPEYNRLLADAEKHCFDIILCKTQSRFSRNMEHIERYLNGKLQEWGIRFVSVLDNADTDVRSNKKARQINGLINEWYLEDLSENVKAVLDNKHREGKSTRPFLPYGLKKCREDKNKIEVDEEAARIVRQIFDYYLSGMGTREIAEFLNAKGILSPQEYKKSKGEKLNIPKKNKRGKWTQQAIIRILKNQMYVGDLVHNIYSKPSYKSKHIIKNSPDKWCIVPNSHDAIISKSDFERVGKMLCKSSVPFDIVCGQCFRKMNVQTKKHKSKTYRYLWCKNCKKRINADFVKNFFKEKYVGQIKKIEITSKYSAKIFFNI